MFSIDIDLSTITSTVSTKKSVTDSAQLVKLLKETFDRKKRGSAEKELERLVKEPGVLPCFLQISTNTKQSYSVRQAATTHLERWIIPSWAVGECDLPGIPICDDDRDKIRESLVSAIVDAPPSFQSQLINCFKIICHHDFRHEWPSLCIQITDCLRSPEQVHWAGGLEVLLAMAKTYPDFGPIEKAAVHEEMTDLLPLIQNVMSAPSIAKAPFTQESLQVHFLLFKLVNTGFCERIPISLFGCERDHWKDFHFILTSVQNILQASLPNLRNKRLEVSLPTEEDTTSLQESWWVVNKWALRVLHALFNTTGPTIIGPIDKKFRQYFSKNWSKTPLELTIRLLERHYLTSSPSTDPVLRQALLLVQVSIRNENTWKFVKPYTNKILTQIIFPLLDLTDADDRLLSQNPKEFVESRYDHRNNDQLVIPCVEQLLRSLLAKNDTQIINTCISHITTVLSNSSVSSTKKFGALHLLGIMSPALKTIREELVIRCVLAYITTQTTNYIRLAACWVLGLLSAFPFQPKMLLHMVAKLVPLLDANSGDPYYVKVAAAFSLQKFLRYRPETHVDFEKKIVKVCFDLVTIIEDTCDLYEVGPTLGTLCIRFFSHVKPNITAIFDRLALTLCKIIEYQPMSKCRSIGIGLLGTMTTIVKLVEDNDPSVLPSLQKPALKMVHLVLVKRMSNFYKHIFNLIHFLSKHEVSKGMWAELEHILNLVDEGDNDTFVHCAPALYNFITVDPDAFLETPAKCSRLIKVVQRVIFKNIEQDNKRVVYVLLNAVKILEVLVLQTGHKIKKWIGGIVDTALDILLYKFGKHPELDSATSQVVLAAMYVDRDWNFFQNMSTRLKDFVEDKIFKVTHVEGTRDRKVFVLGLCSILQKSVTQRGSHLHPTTIKKLMSKLVKLFIDLEQVYQHREAEKIRKQMETLGQSLITPSTIEARSEMIQYQVFKNTLISLQRANPGWYDKLIHALSSKEQAKILEIVNAKLDKTVKLPRASHQSNGDEEVKVSKMSLSPNQSMASIKQKLEELKLELHSSSSSSSSSTTTSTESSD